MTAALLIGLLVASQEAQRQYLQSSLSSAIIDGRWETVDAIKRQVASFKHPISPNSSSRWDILSDIVIVSYSSYNYGNVLTGVRICIEHGADPNARGGLPLFIAAGIDNYRKVIERLLEYGADPDGSKDGYRPLIRALRYQRFHRTVRLGLFTDNLEFFTDNLEILLEHKADPNLPTRDTWWKTGDGGTRSVLPLSYAAATGQAEAAEMLIEAGAKVDAREPATGWTALHDAAAGIGKVNGYTVWNWDTVKNRAPVIRVLLNAGADKSIKDNQGRTPLDIARANDDADLIAALGVDGQATQGRRRVRPYTLTNLHTAVVHGNWDRVDAVKRQVGSFKHPIWPKDDWDILSWIAHESDSAFHYDNLLAGLRVCAEYGADPNAREGAPLFYAAVYDRYNEVTERLIEYGADPDGSKEGYRPLIGALQAFRLGNVEILLDHKADPNLATRDDWWYVSFGKWRSVLPLSYAAATGQTEAAEMLIEAGAKVNARDPATGWTALHDAAAGFSRANGPTVWNMDNVKVRAPIVKLLLKMGADKSIKDKQGRTPLDIARAKKDKALIAALGG